MFSASLRIPLFVSILFSPISTFAQKDTSSPLQGIFPPLTPFINYGNLIITYEPSRFILQGDINSGVEATPNDTSTAPNAISIVPFEDYGNPLLPINTTQLYTLVMIDPDAPSRASPTAAQILHFVQAGLKITTGLGETESVCLELTATVPPVIPYHGPAPPVDTGLHRYISLLFMQSGDTVDLGSFSADMRRGFNVESFAKNNTFGPPLAGAYFRAQNAGNSGNTTAPEDDTAKTDFIAIDGPLVIDTSSPTPPARQTSDPYPMVTLSEIVYEGTLTHSLSPSMTGEVDGDPETDSVEYSGRIGHWTMTAPGVDEHVVVTTTTEAPVPTLLEIDTSSIPTLQGSGNCSASVTMVQHVGSEKPSASASVSATSRLDGPINDNSAVGESTGVVMLMGVLAGGTIYITSIL